MAVGACALVVAIAGVASAAARDFEHPANHTPADAQQQLGLPLTDPQRADTPNDPGYDIAEPDDPDSKLNGGPFDASTNIYDEDFGFFGFPSVRTRATAIYTAGPNLATCTAKAIVPCPQISGFNASGAWKLERGPARRGGRGARHRDQVGPRRPAHADAPQQGRAADPQARPTAPTAASYDCNGDGAFNVTDYADDPRVSLNGGSHGVAGQIDAEDLIAAFSDAQPTPTRNGFVDDIAGWDFFDNDNDPYDASSYFAAANHGSGRDEGGRRARERRRGLDRRLPALSALADPHLGHLRLRRQRLRDGNALRHRQRRVGDRGRERLHLPLGVRRAGVAVRVRPRGRADLLGRRPQHRQPQLRRQLRPRDADPGDRSRHRWASARTPATRPRRPWRGSAGPAGAVGCPGTSIPALTYFRGANTTQYGGKSSISMEGSTGSENTGKAAGAAGLVVSAARDASPAVDACAQTRRGRSWSRRPSACWRRTPIGAGHPRPRRRPDEALDRPVDDALRLGPGECGRCGRASRRAGRSRRRWQSTRRTGTRR